MSLALPLDSSLRQRTSLCWVFSMSIHGLLIGMAIVLLTEIPPPPPPTFKWDVAMVQAPPPAPEPAPAPPVESQSPPTPQPVAPPPPKQVVQPVKTQPVVQPVQRMQEPQPVQQVQPVQESLPVQTAQPIQQVTTQQVETVTQTIQETISPITEVAQTVVEHTAVVQETTPVVQQYSEPHAVASTEPVTRQAEPVTQVAVVVSDAAPIEAPQQVEQAIVQRPAETVQHRVVQQRTVRARPGERPDFGWLSQALWSSVDQRKRYPAEAKRNRWEGRVILRLTIEQRGAAVHLLDLVLEESSGHSVLDRHTLDMVRNAFPLQVKHQLALAKMQLDLPFSYRME
jgi:protein TonB